MNEADKPHATQVPWAWLLLAAGSLAILAFAYWPDQQTRTVTQTQAPIVSDEDLTVSDLAPRRVMSDTEAQQVIDWTEQYSLRLITASARLLNDPEPEACNATLNDLETIELPEFEAFREQVRADIEETEARARNCGPLNGLLIDADRPARNEWSCSARLILDEMQEWQVEGCQLYVDRS